MEKETGIKMELRKVDRIEKETALFCLDDCIATLAGYYHCDYEMMYAGGYEMREQKEIWGFASRYHVSLQHRFDNLRRYHGLYIYKSDCLWKRRLIKRIKTELQQGRPVLLLLNPCWCPWDDGFQRYDAVPGHCFLVQREYDEGFLCADPYFDKDRLELSYSLFRKGIQEVYLTRQVERTDSSHTSGKAYREELENMFRRMSGEGYFEVLYHFVDDMSQSEDIFEEVRSDADFSSIGNCYVLNDTEGTEPVRIPGTAVTLSSIGGTGNDNIACDGQEIPVPENRYSHLCLIGAAEFGNSTDVLRIVSGSGREYEVEFQFTDYIYEPCFGETVVWKGCGIHKLENGYEWMEEDLYLYGQMLEMPDDVIFRKYSTCGVA